MCVDLAVAKDLYYFHVLKSFNIVCYFYCITLADLCVCKMVTLKKAERTTLEGRSKNRDASNAAVISKRLLHYTYFLLLV